MPLRHMHLRQRNGLYKPWEWILSVWGFLLFWQIITACREKVFAKSRKLMGFIKDALSRQLLELIKLSLGSIKVCKA